MKFNCSKACLTPEMHIVDGDGRRRLTLSAASGAIAIRMFRADGRPSITVPLDQAARIPPAPPSDVNASNLLAEPSESGTRVKFVRPGGGASYLYLNEAGESGVVVTDAHGQRRLVASTPANGHVKIEKYDADGRPLPA